MREWTLLGSLDTNLLSATDEPPFRDRHDVGVVAIQGLIRIQHQVEH